MELYIKSNGKYEKREMAKEEYLKWFKDNTDKEGNVKTDCAIYKDASLSVNTDKSFSWVMSDGSLDRDFEKLDPKGWDLKSFKQNPVMQWGHDGGIPAIGLIERPRVKDEKLIGNPVFDEQDEFAMKVKGKVERGIIKMGSVQFAPSKIEFVDDEKDPCRLIYRKQELREFSICNVPANPNATVVTDGKEDDSKETPVKVTVTIDKEVLDRLESIENDITNLKEMQMDLQGKIDKDNKSYYDVLLNKKSKPQPKGLEILYPKSKQS